MSGYRARYSPLICQTFLSSQAHYRWFYGVSYPGVNIGCQEEHHFSSHGTIYHLPLVLGKTQSSSRFLLGFLQGGFIPDTILYLSYFYTKTERRCSSCFIDAYSEPSIVPIRLAWFWMSNYMTQIVGAFLATGILQLREHNGVAGWRYLFLIEGIFTCLCGLFSFALMPPAPTQTKAWFRPNGWFTER